MICKNFSFILKVKNVVIDYKPNNDLLTTTNCENKQYNRHRQNVKSLDTPTHASLIVTIFYNASIKHEQYAFTYAAKKKKTC